MKLKYNFLLAILIIGIIFISGCISDNPKTPSISKQSTKESLAGWLFRLGDDNAIFLNYNDQINETNIYDKKELEALLGFNATPSEKSLISFNQARNIAIKENKTRYSDEEMYDYGVFCYKHSKYNVEHSNYTGNFVIFPIIRNVDSKTHVTGWMAVSDYFKTSKAIYDGATPVSMNLLKEHFGGSKGALVPLAKVMKYMDDHNTNKTIKDQLCVIYEHD